MQILQIIAMAKKVLDILNSDQAKVVIAAIKELIAGIWGETVADYVAAKLESRASGGMASVACPCPDDGDCPCDAAELAAIEAALAD